MRSEIENFDEGVEAVWRVVFEEFSEEIKYTPRKPAFTGRAGKKKDLKFIRRPVRKKYTKAQKERFNRKRRKPLNIGKTQSVLQMFARFAHSQTISENLSRTLWSTTSA